MEFHSRVEVVYNWFDFKFLNIFCSFKPYYKYLYIIN